MKMDKKYHILAGFLVAALVALPAYLESVNLFAGLWSAIFAAVIAGGVKEWADMRHGYRFDGWDFLATVIGGIVVVLLILGLHFGKG